MSDNRQNPSSEVPAAVDVVAYQRFLGACRQFWAGPLFQALRRQVQTELAADPETEHHLDAILTRHPTHQYFAWLERHVQRLKYSGRWGVTPTLQASRAASAAVLRQPLPDGLLTLDAALKAPAYYHEYDIHQHPGGLWDDEIAGLIYRESARQSGGVVGVPQLHQRFARTAIGSGRPMRILDLGCGFGRSTEAFAAEARDASVAGIDLSAGCLRLAAAELSVELRTRVAYRQADALAAPYPDGHFDLVTSTMLLHEMPEEAIVELIMETGRLLAPGGVAVHLDFLPPADPFLRALYAGHSRRNNEPFMAGLGRIDFRAAYARAGFRDVEIVAFGERDDISPMGDNWRLPWTVFRARRGPADG